MPIQKNDKESNTLRSLSSRDLLLKHLLPVGFSGMVDRIIFHPVETIITHQQNSGVSAKIISKNLWREGFSKFYPGYIPSVLTSIPMRMSIFSTYSIIKEIGKNNNFSPIPTMLFGGVFTGFLEGIIICPSEAYRTKKTLQETTQSKFTVKHIFKGFWPLVLKNSSENVVCLVGADILLKTMPDDLSNSKMAPYISGFISGYASQFVSTPFDVVKTKLMKEPDKKLSASIKELVGQGVGTFFRSTWMKALRAGQCNAMMIGTSHLIKNFIESRDEDSSGNLENTSKKI